MYFPQLSYKRSLPIYIPACGGKVVAPLVLEALTFTEEEPRLNFLLSDANGFLDPASKLVSKAITAVGDTALIELPFVHTEVGKFEIVTCLVATCAASHKRDTEWLSEHARPLSIHVKFFESGSALPVAISSQLSVASTQYPPYTPRVMSAFTGLMAGATPYPVAPVDLDAEGTAGGSTTTAPTPTTRTPSVNQMEELHRRILSHFRAVWEDVEDTFAIQMSEQQ